MHINPQKFFANYSPNENQTQLIWIRHCTCPHRAILGIQRSRPSGHEDAPYGSARGHRAHWNGFPRPDQGDRLRRIPAGQSGTAAGPSRRPITPTREGDGAASAHCTLSVKIAPIDVKSGRTDASAQDESFGYLAFAADLDRHCPDRLSARYVRIRRCRDHWMQRHRLASGAPGPRERRPAAPSDRRAGG